MKDKELLLYTLSQNRDEFNDSLGKIDIFNLDILDELILDLEKEKLNYAEEIDDKIECIQEHVRKTLDKQNN